MLAAIFVDDAGHRLQHRVHGRSRRQRSGLTEAGNGIVDDLRFLGADRVVAEAMALNRAGTKALEEHVGAAQQPPQHLLALRRLQVERDAALAQRAEQRIGRVILVAAPEDARPIAAVVRGFHLDDVGPVLRQEHGAGRTGDAAAEIDHRQSGEGRRVSHASDSLDVAAVIRASELIARSPSASRRRAWHRRR